MFNMYNNLPRFVFLKNEKYKINTDFRIFITFEEQMQGGNKKQAIYNCLNSFYPLFLDIMQKNLINEAIDSFLWFYKCGKEVETKSGKSGGGNQIYSYGDDDQYIWGAFYSQYKIDLSKDFVHWWKFKAMWLSLDSECQFSKIRGYRAYNGKDKDLLSLKEQYKLSKNIHEQKRQNEIFEELNKIKTSQ